MVYDELIKKLALENALKFKGKANPKALVGGVMKVHAEAKSQMKDVVATIASVVEEVNALSVEEQKSLLLVLDPDFEKNQQEQKKARKEQRASLPDLPNAEQGKVVTRIAPGPSKYNHLGHAMSFLINYLYAKKYDGKVIFRFEDTNPDADAQIFVDAMQEDCFNYLGIKPDQTIFASDDIPKFYEYVEELINKGHAYVSNDTSEEISAQRRAMQPSKDREKSVEENLQLWSDMKEGKALDYTVRLKIDAAHKNAVMRDPVIMRVNTNEHYRQKNKFNVWPMFDFENPIEEGLTGVTHAMRSNEFDSRIELHNYIARLLNFPDVVYKHYGRYNVTGATTQGREIRALIESGKYIGWDDPRLVTLRALKRRGIVKEAFYELAQKIGFSKQMTNLDYGVIAAVNRSLLDTTAKRFFAVCNPVAITINNIPESIKEFHLSYHPDGEKGERKLSCTKEYYVEKKDISSLAIGDVIRLMDAINIKKVDETIFEFVSESYDEYKTLSGKGLIHFVPKDGNEMRAEVLLADTSIQEIICESNVGMLKPDMVIQFERYAFVRFDHVKEDGTIQFWYTHD